MRQRFLHSWKGAGAAAAAACFASASSYSSYCNEYQNETNCRAAAKCNSSTGEDGRFSSHVQHLRVASSWRPFHRVCFAEAKTTDIDAQSSAMPPPLRWCAYATRGPRGAMEDRHFISPDETFYAVYDGHGGAAVASYAAHNAYRIIMEESAKENCDDKENSESIGKALRRSFARVSEEVLRRKSMDFQGSTAVAVWRRGSSLWTVNIGDSRAVLCKKGEAVDLTNDHKPNEAGELKRIQSLGGTVRWYGYLGPDRQPLPGMGSYRINGNLAVSRALGDRLERPYVSSEPDISRYDISDEDDQFIILASDGMWDVMTSQQAVEFVRLILSGSVSSLAEGAAPGRTNSSKNWGMRPIGTPLHQWMREYADDSGMLRAVIDTRKEKMSQYLVEECLRRGTSDNVTVLIMWLK